MLILCDHQVEVAASVGEPPSLLPPSAGARLPPVRQASDERGCHVPPRWAPAPVTTLSSVCRSLVLLPLRTADAPSRCGLLVGLEGEQWAA